MSELTVSQLIKIILGVLVFVAVLIGLYFLFKNKILEFFKNIYSEDFSKIILIFLK